MNYQSLLGLFNCNNIYYGASILEKTRIRIESNGTIYEITANLVIAHMAKKKIRVTEEKHISDNKYEKILRKKVEEYPPVLEYWLLTKMTWADIKRDAVLISGPPIEITDWKTIKTNILK